MRRLWITLALVLGLLPGPLRANPIANVICAPSAELRERLQRGFQAERTWNGLRNPDQLMELWEDGQGDWTLVIANSNGSSCIVAMGTAMSPYGAIPQG